MGLRIEIDSPEQWKRARKRGYRHWILRKGIIEFAVPGTLLHLVFFYLIDLIVLQGELQPWWLVILGVVTLSVAAGYFLAHRVWQQAREHFE